MGAAYALARVVRLRARGGGVIRWRWWWLAYGSRVARVWCVRAAYGSRVACVWRTWWRTYGVRCGGVVVAVRVVWRVWRLYGAWRVIWRAYMAGIKKAAWCGLCGACGVIAPSLQYVAI